MEITNRAKEYLQSLDRNPDWTISESEAEIYFKKLKIPNPEKLIEIQNQYSGYQLTVNENPRTTFNIHLIPKIHAQKNKNSSLELISGEIFIELKDNPLSYFLSEDGKICSKDEDKPTVIHTNYSSIEIVIEEYAFLNEFYYFKSFESMYSNIKDLSSLKKELDNFQFIKECSDDMNFFWKNDFCIIKAGRWFGAEGFYFSIFGIEEKFCNEISQKLEKKGIIE